ncbi:hypothetical protein PLESTF_001194800 [Pleodorina starrii]|nr:hypothetical protein PLESTF_001194800 [Pleodorina starrii]
MRLAKGAENVAAFQEEYGVDTGDTIEATFDIRNRNASANGRPVLAGQEDDSDDPTYKLRPGSIRVLDRANRQKEIYNGTTIDITAVVYLAEFCGFKNPFQSHQGKIATNVYGIFHELQHNTGLMHAATWDLEYGDKSDPMGDIYVSTTNEPQCHNPVSNWKINWAIPVPGGYLTHTSFTPRTNRLTFTIPASSVSDKNMVIVDLGIVPTDVKYTTSRPRLVKYFLAYRVRNTTAGGYDSGLISFFNQKVTIHRSDISAAANDNLLSTIYLSAGPRFGAATGGDPTFPDGNVWKSPFVPVDPVNGTGGGIRVKVVSRDLTQAVVEVCRMYAQTEGTPGSAECRANLDRDW